MFKNFLWIFSEKGLITLLQFTTLLVLSRFLTPEDYGVYGVMMIFIAVSEMLIDSGFGGALIQKRDITRVDISTLFFTNIAISLVLYGLIYVLSPLLESYYQIQNLATYFRVIGITIVIYAFSIVQNSLLIRNMQFKKSTIINCVSTLLSSIIAILLSILGCGIWALVFQLLANSIIMTILLWINNRIIIDFKISRNSFLHLWRFGSNLVFGNILQTIINNICTSIIPKIGDVTKAGLYFQSLKITNIPVNVLTLSIDKGVFPILSKEKNEYNICLKARLYNRSFLAFFIPLFPLLSISSTPLIVLLLGNKWEAAGGYFSILIWSGLGLMIQGLFRNIVKSIGDTSVIFRIEIYKSVITLAILLASIKFGVIFIVYGYVIASFIGAAIWSFILSHKYSYTASNQLEDTLKPIVATIIIYFLCLVTSQFCEGTWLLLISFLGYITYIFLGYFIHIEEISQLLLKSTNYIKKHVESK